MAIDFSPMIPLCKRVPRNVSHRDVEMFVERDHRASFTRSFSAAYTDCMNVAALLTIRKITGKNQSWGVTKDAADMSKNPRSFAHLDAPQDANYSPTFSTARNASCGMST